MRIVITGVGVVAPNGIGKAAFWDNCFAGVSGIKPVTLFDTHPYRCHRAGEITEFAPEEYVGSKGLRTLDRTTRLALVAAQLALQDAQMPLPPAPGNDLGVVLGSTTGSLHSISDFDLVGLREGPRYVNPALFPNAVINSPASQVAIRFQLQGLNSTIATGFTASLDAFGYALDMLRLERSQALLVGGVEELCLETFVGFDRLGLLAPADNGQPWFAPFHPRRCGTLLGEGAAFFVLESIESARQRNVPVYAEILGYGTAFHPNALHRHDDAAEGVVQALAQVLDLAGVGPAEVDYISACANGTRGIDAMEVTALKAVFGARASRIPASAVKSLLGEAFSASGALQVALALGAMVRQQIPPTIHGAREESWTELNLVPERAQPATVETVLVESFGSAGIASALVMRGVHDGRDDPAFQRIRD